MCVMSRYLYECAKGLLVVDTDIRWSIGSANSTIDKVYGVRHSIAVEVSRIQIPVPVFHSQGHMARVYLEEKVGSVGTLAIRQSAGWLTINLDYVFRRQEESHRLCSC